MNNQLEEALIIYQVYIERFGKSAILLAMIARLYFILAMGNANETGENFNRAIAYLQDALNLKSKDASLHVQLAEIYALGVLVSRQS